MRPVPIPPAAVAAILAGVGLVPQLAIVSDGDRRVLQVGPWSTTSVPNPSAVSFAGPDGLTDTIAEAADLRGPATIATLTSADDPGASLTLDPVNGDVFRTTGT